MGTEPKKKTRLRSLKNQANENRKETAEELYMKPGFNPDDLPPYSIYDPVDYCDGPEGFLQWCEDKVWVPIYPEGETVATWYPIHSLPTDINTETGRSYKDFWDLQKDELRKCLRMVNGRFVYRLLVFCWPRGEGKSLIVCLIQLWKFFNFSRQQIVLGANSKDQVQFVHYDIMRDIILNSPDLLAELGRKNIKEKDIRRKDSKGRITSRIRAISSFTGIVSNITGYTFSEMFDMKNSKFFTQLDGSIRNIPNALGTIDSTVSEKTHILYSLFQSYVHRKSKTIYFSYRFSIKAKSNDYMNPYMTQAQLDDYRAKFLPADFDRYFRNVWSSGSEQYFSEELLELMECMGCDGKIGNWMQTKKLIEEKWESERMIDEFRMKGMIEPAKEAMGRVEQIRGRLIPVSRYYTLKNAQGLPGRASVMDLVMLGDLFETDWLVMGGVDRADPLKGSKLGARTIYSCIAKGLPGSRGIGIAMNPEAVPAYIYVVLNLMKIETHSLEDIKEVIMIDHQEYEGMDTLCSERWGTWDIVQWCEDNYIAFEPVFPTYDRQKGAFSELFLAMNTGRFKSPPILVEGSKGPNIFKEEALAFVHDVDKRWFGSMEKYEKYGIQDDAMFSVTWCMHGGREKDVTEFRARKGMRWFGSFATNKAELAGNY